MGWFGGWARCWDRLLGTGKGLGRSVGTGKGLGRSVGTDEGPGRVRARTVKGLGRKALYRS